MLFLIPQRLVVILMRKVPSSLTRVRADSSELAALFSCSRFITSQPFQYSGVIDIYAIARKQGTPHFQMPD